MQVVSGDAVGGYIAGRLGVHLTPPFQAMGFLGGDGRPLAAALFNGFNGSSIEVSIVAEPGGLTRSVIRYVAQYAFVHCGCRRLQAHVSKRNKRMLRLMPRLGFKFEAVAAGYYPDSDAVVFRGLANEQRWIDVPIRQSPSEAA
jgi:hypothetical protein